jgi:non-ribosomal peptide synthetase component F/thioesterase domain-containing protein/acyl carrier protein
MSARLRLLAVPTAKQPASLQRTLRSFAEHLAGVGRPLPTAVFHSPRTAAEQTEVQAAVIAAGGTAQYVGLREKLAVAKQLLKATSVAPELLEFALFQNEHAAHAAGADRNAALLWGAGGQILCTDDDTRAEFFTHAERSPDESLSVTRSGEPQETGSGAAPASAHGGIAGVFEDAWDAALAAGSAAPLVIAGVACAGSVHAARRLVLSRGGPAASATLGIDAAGELPPFLPIGRGQTRLFGAMVERLRNAPSLYLPLAVARDRPLEAAAPAGLCLADVFLALLARAPVGADLAALGRYFKAQAARGDAVEALRLASSETFVVADAGGDGSLARVCEVIASYGTLCEAWPALLRAARDRVRDAEGAARYRPAPAAAQAMPEPMPACSPWQTWLWRLQRLDPADATAVVYRAFRATAPIDADLLERSLRALLGRHQALRCRLVGAADADPRLELRPAEELIVRRAAPLGAALFRDARAAEHSRPFELSTELPVRVTLQPDADRPGESELWVSVHHIAYDGASEEIFWRELQTIFKNLANGKSALAGLAPLRSTFVELVQRQRAALDERTMHALERHWQEKFAGAPERLLVSWRSTETVTASETCQLYQPFPRELADGLRLLGRERHTSVAMLSLAAFEALLFRWSGERDQIIALEFAGRCDEIEEDQIGLFMSPIALRADLSGDPSLLDLASQNRALLGDALARRVPLERLLSALGTGRRRFAGFRIYFSHLARGEPPSLGATPLWEVPPGLSFERTDLRLVVEERPGGMSVNLAGATALFDQGDLARLANAFQYCLAQLCRRPEVTLSQLEWICASDRMQLASWNSTAAGYLRDQPLTLLLQAQATRTPMATALEVGDLRLTYAELFERAGALAARLKQVGVRREARVGLYLDRHATLPQAMLAILDAGGAYVPLDPAFPRERLAFMVEDAGVCTIVTRRALLPELPPHSAQVICVDDDPPVGPPATGWLPADASSLAYVLYTSGSTGKPKGVQVEHRQLVNFLHSMARCPGIDPSDALMAVTSVSFDIAGLEIWLPLFCGARICLAGREEVADAKLLKQALARSRATILQASPSTWRALLASGWSCGEAWNLYGPTETTIWSSAWRLPRAVGRVRVGKPIANTELHVLDEGLRPLPIGVPGELFIGGEGVARGYLNRPELTAQRFVGDPFRGGAARMYRTGDLARWLPDGSLDLLGRNDDQLKVRGQRIEATEVEAALLRLPGVAQAAVALHRPEIGDPRLVAYLVPRPGAQLPPSAELRAELRQWLTEYMLPYHFVQLVVLPLTPNGKVDRRKLAQLGPEPEPAAAVEFAPPAAASVMEADLVAHFDGVLGRTVTLDSDFFEAGGDSLGALRLISRLSQERGLELTSGELFLHSTPRRMAARLEQLLAGAAPPRHLLRLRGGRSRDSVFLVHPIGGHLAPYARLAHHLGDSAALFGLQAGAGKRPYQSIGQRCAAYVEEVMAASSGPLILGGYSLGGALALEMAEQLRRAGRVVSLVLMLDAAVPRRLERGWAKLRHRATELRRFSWRDRRIWLSEQVSRRFLHGPADERDFGEAEVLIDSAEMKSLFEQALRWQPPRYAGKVRLVRADRNLRGYPNPAGALGWDRYCTDLEVLDLPCNHVEILVEPQVLRIVAEMESLLDERSRA